MNMPCPDCVYASCSLGECMHPKSMPIARVTQRDRMGRLYARYVCSYLGHLHISHRQAQACNVRARAKVTP